MRFAVSYDGYCKSEGVKVYEGTDELAIWADILTNHSYGPYILKVDEEDERPIASIEEALIALSSMNGDGCDFVISIIDLDNGTILFDCSRD